MPLIQPPIKRLILRLHSLRNVGVAALVSLAVLSSCSKAKLNNAMKPLELMNSTIVSITSISPPTGLISGGTVITIDGTGFKPGATVTVDGAACTNVVVVSVTQLTCTTPAGAVGTADVVVTVPAAAQDGTLLAGFLYTVPVNPVAGTAVTSGGRVATGGVVQVQAAIGEIGGPPNIQTSAGVSSLSGVHGALWQP